MTFLAAAAHFGVFCLKRRARKEDRSRAEDTFCPVSLLNSAVDDHNRFSQSQEKALVRAFPVNLQLCRLIVCSTGPELLHLSAECCAALSSRTFDGVTKHELNFSDDCPHSIFLID